MGRGSAVCVCVCVCVRVCRFDGVCLGVHVSRRNHYTNARSNTKIYKCVHGSV